MTSSRAPLTTTSPVLTATRSPAAPSAGLHADERAKRLLHRDRGAHGAERVVLGHARQAEGRHHAVAEELHDRAAVRVDGGAQRRVVALHHAPRRLRVEALVQRGRADEVGEDDA